MNPEDALAQRLDALEERIAAPLIDWAQFTLPVVNTYSTTSGYAWTTSAPSGWSTEFDKAKRQVERLYEIYYLTREQAQHLLAAWKPGYVLDKTHGLYTWVRNEPPLTEGEPLMLEQVIRLYHAYMMQDVRSPIPHLAGPPGVGKSETVQQLADLLGVKLHIINVARLSPLELEGVQMPVGNPTNIDEYRLHLLTSTIWTQLKEGDIVLLDEFMRGFPEVYNGLLDIMTSRQVAGFHLPKVFFIGASNSVAAYDKALEDRLLHLFVPDPRKSKTARRHIKQLLINEIGLHPDAERWSEMDELLDHEVLPMYAVLDQFTHKAALGTTTIEGSSVRKLIGQAKLRAFQSRSLISLVDMNNQVAMMQGKPQYVVLRPNNLSSNEVKAYPTKAAQLKGNPRLTPVQSQNLALNLALLDMAAARTEQPLEEEGEPQDDDVFN